MGYTAVGKRTPRLDAPAHVTGTTQFTADLALPGMVWGVVLRSGYPHAQITRIDAAKASRMPGVLAIATGEDIPGLARGKARYHGEAIAAIAAETREQAIAARRAIKVTYEPLPVVTDVRAAIEPGAPRIHTDSESRELPNVADETTVRRGDVAAGFAAADRIFEDTFETPWVHQGYLEPHVAIADWDAATARMTVWTSSQGQFGVRSSVARALGIPVTSVRVVVPAVGGGFGGKGAVILEPIAAVLSRRCGRPVKMLMTREEEFLANRPCGGSVLELKTGVKSDGRIVALEARLLFDTGAYRGAQAGTGATLVQGPYRIPNLLVTAYAVYTNKPSAGARRALTAPHVHFAIESQLDIIARSLGIDPLEIRLRNVMRAGDPVAGGTMPYSLPEKVIRAAAARAGWSRREKRGTGMKPRGVGLAAGHWTCWASPSAADVYINDDGTVSVVTGAVNLSGTDTSFAQIAAESFGIPVARVAVTQGDTDNSPHNAGTHHSRVLFGVGAAVVRACEDAKRQLAEALAQDLGVTPDQVEVSDGRIDARGGQSISLADAAARAVGYRGAIVGRAALNQLPFSISSCAQVAEVEVDRQTGRWELKRLVCAQDVGYAINPMSVEGQIEGGASHGVGYALSEEYIYDEGRLLNANLMDFRMPTSLDHPEFDVALIEEQVDTGPYGAKGVGEPPTIPTAPAIANAIFDAVGVRVRQLPITPERVYRELRRIDEDLRD